MGLEPKLLNDALRQPRPVPPPLSLADPLRADGRTVDQIYRDEAHAIRTFVRRIVRHTCDAEDLVQDTFARSWQVLASGKVECPRAFLFRTARNLALNHIRNNRVRNSEAVRTASEEVFKRPSQTAEELIIASEEAEACHRLLNQLPLRCREAFVLWVVDEMSYKQMSRSMRLSVSTVEKHIGKGKQICRSLLTDPERGGTSLEVLMSRIPAPYRAVRRSAQHALENAAA
jgi:RNA polymerase sigma factor (sigma-70 family)